MKKYKWMFYILLAVLVLLSSSCGFLKDQQYSCNVDAVESVQIVELTGFNKEKLEYEYTVLAEIADYTTFVERLNNLEQRYAFIGDPAVFEIGYTVIRIDYFGGDYDLVHNLSYRQVRSGTITSNGYCRIDREQFDALIADYMPE